MNNNIIRNVTVTVDMNRMNRVVNTRAVFNQRDVKTAVILCNIDMGGLVNLSNCTVKADILKPDGTNVVTLCQILDEEKGLVAIGLNNQCLSAIGEVRCELSIQSETQTLYSPVLVYNVVDNLFDLENEEITSQNDYPILSQLISLVQNIETELEALEIVIQTNELDRNNNEEIRKQNEILRQAYLEKIKTDIIEINDIFEEKVQLISSELERINTDVSNSIKEIDETILEVENMATSMNNIFDSKVELVNSKVVLLDSKLSEINQTIIDCNDATETNINKMTHTTNSFISNIQTTMDNSILNMKTSVSEKITEMESTTNNVINSIDDTINNSVEKVDMKCLEVTNKMTEVDEVITTIEHNEADRIQAEIDRENNYNELVSIFDVLDSDVDDIINMIGEI